jgi:hypothetical protein
LNEWTARTQQKSEAETCQVERVRSEVETQSCSIIRRNLEWELDRDQKEEKAYPR